MLRTHSQQANANANGFGEVFCGFVVACVAQPTTLALLKYDGYATFIGFLYKYIRRKKLIISNANNIKRGI